MTFGNSRRYRRTTGLVCAALAALIGCETTTDTDGAEETLATASVVQGLITACPTGYGPSVGGLLLIGTDGDDVLVGGAGKDCILGNGGNDTLEGNGGADYIAGGDGDDVIHGGDGNDTVHGETGNDTLFGDAGNDQLRGEDGVDTLFGGDGNDTLYGYAGNDSLNGEAGKDRLFGGPQDDTLSGGPGDDSLQGDSGNDLLNGDEDDDRLHGSADNDELHGGTGNDELFGEVGDDKLFGEVGDDKLSGDDGNDTLVGDVGDDQLLGGAGVDDLSGGPGNDLGDEGGNGGPLKGDEGNDVLLHSPAADGGPGADVCSGTSCEEPEPRATCTSDADCVPGRTCATAFGVCLYCQSNTVCGSNYECRPTHGCTVPLEDACRTVNGIRWCFDPNDCGQSCEDVCDSLGLFLGIDDATWFAAQDTQAECQAINDAFSLGGTAKVGNFLYACAEDQGGPHLAPGGLRGPLVCSTFSGCPSAHRTSADPNPFPHCFRTTFRSVCPCR